jgi:FMN phosphatase YigB (HAD superfamily)
MAVKANKGKKSPAKQTSPFWLVLDVHGVLIPNSERWILGRLAKELHISRLDVYLRWFLNLRDAQLGKMPAKKFYEHVFDQKISDAVFNRTIMKLYSSRGLFSPAHVHELKRLKKAGWKLAVLSDMNTAQADFHRARSHFVLFDQVSLSCETGLMKPFPSSFVALEKRMKTRKDHIVFCDDMWMNTLSASLQGWKAVTIKGQAQLARFLKDLK